MENHWRSNSRSPRTGAEATARLQQLGFARPAAIREALQDGASAARSVDTTYHPASSPGMRMWAETTASLAKLAGADWTRESFRGVDLVTNHLRGVAIIVTSGDVGAGHEDFPSNVRYPRQEIITGLVNGELDTLWDAARGRASWSMWLLLHNLDRKQHLVPAEVSLPTGIDKAGQVVGWAERIIVPDFSDGWFSGKRTEGQNDSPIVPVVDVKRRAV